ncbi:hypothetical protein PENTCL1PPCAC_4198, partial [Pristionchus entomophagus]
FQSIIEIFFIYAYAFSEMVFNDLVFGKNFVLNSGFVYPMFAYYGAYYYMNHAQVWGVTMLSLNRYVTVCRPTSSMARYYDTIGTPLLWTINVTVPLLMVARMLFQGPVYYNWAESQVEQYTPMHIVKSNALQGMIVSLVGSIVCAVCYFLVIRGLTSSLMSRNGCPRLFNREKILTIAGFALFVALCISTLFYVLIHINAAKENDIAVIAIRQYYIYGLMALTFIKPWMLLITNKNARRK